jgi:hypothetical protein
MLVVPTIVAPPAFACACCSERASRTIATEAISEQRLREIGEMVFARPAALTVRESEETEATVQGLGSAYQLEVTRESNAMVFAFRNVRNEVGTLVLAIPETISIFEVDPRGDEKDEGLGPLLYKEWSLTAKAAGTGLFERLVKIASTMTLVLHGRGRGCTEASHFTDWTLVVPAGSGRVTLYGALESGR